MRAWTLLFFAVVSYLLGAIATPAMATIEAFGLSSWFQYAEPVSLGAALLFAIAAGLLGLNALLEADHTGASPSRSRSPE